MWRTICRDAPHSHSGLDPLPHVHKLFAHILLFALIVFGVAHIFRGSSYPGSLTFMRGIVRVQWGHCSFYWTCEILVMLNSFWSSEFAYWYKASSRPWLNATRTPWVTRHELAQ